MTLQREIHISDEQAGDQPRFEFTLLYSDGMGRQLQKKLKVEGGLAWVNQPTATSDHNSYKEQNSEEPWLTSGRYCL